MDIADLHPRNGGRLFRTLQHGWPVRALRSEFHTISGYDMIRKLGDRKGPK
jgi:hypothetical protein